MRKTIFSMILALCMVATVCTAISIAQDETETYNYVTSGVTLRIWGYVAETDGTTPIRGATVELSSTPPITVTTGSNGRYDIYTHSYCGYKTMTVVKSGYNIVRKKVYDHSCPECEGNNESDICRTSLMTNIILRPADVIDNDGDGILNSFDNCVDIPNGFLRGTCTTGLRGRTCYKSQDCGCGGVCSMAQQDCDGNGIGDACDLCVRQVGGCYNCNGILESLVEVTPAHELATIASADDPIGLWVLLSMMFGAHNAQEYPDLLHFVVGVFNGPDYLMCNGVRIPTHDFDGDGIADEEQGGVPLNLTPRDYRQAMLDAIQKCMVAEPEE